ncbi:MAG: LamG domain-containing protein [Planctomycetes bacterium]|nr:LamG domain-containing protein [Planctomycetota bacterium]
MTRMKVRETDRLSIEFRWKGGKDALGIRTVIWAKRGAGSARRLSLRESAICVLALDKISRPTSAGGAPVTRDATKNGIHGEIHGAASIDGAVGRGLQFDGVDDFVLLPKLHKHVTQDLEAISVSLWLKPSDKNGMTFDVGFYGSSVTMWSGPDAVFVISKKAGGTSLKFKEPTDGKWHHIVAVWDGKSQIVYLDGRLAAETKTTQAGTLGKKTIGFGPGRLGSQSKSADRKSRFFRGALDEVAVFGTALSEEAVKTLFQLRDKSRSVVTLVK